MSLRVSCTAGNSYLKLGVSSYTPNDTPLLVSGLGTWFFYICYYKYLTPQLKVFSFQIVILILLIKLLSNLTHEKENNGVKRSWEGPQAWSISSELPPGFGPDL